MHSSDRTWLMAVEVWTTSDWTEGEGLMSAMLNGGGRASCSSSGNDCPEGEGLI